MLVSLDKDEFDQTFGDVFSQVFTMPDGMGPAFRHSKWGVIVVPGPIDYLEFSHRLALIRATGCVGDSSLVLKALGTDTALVQAAVLDFCSTESDRLELEKLGITAGDCAGFGASGRWGALSMQSHDGITWIGGDSQFLSVLVAEAGGKTQLQNDFLRFAEQSWMVTAELRAYALSTVRGYDAFLR